MNASIFHLEPFARFLHRAVDLNRLHNPDDAVHGPLLLDTDGWLQLKAVHEAGGKPSSAGAAVAAVADTASGPVDLTEAVRARKALYTIHANFPAGAPVHEQAAFLLRAFAGLQPFAEANFRTGWDYLAALLEHNHRQLLASDAEARELATDLWERLQSRPNGFDRKNALDRDAAFAWLAEWFRHRIA